MNMNQFFGPKAALKTAISPAFLLMNKRKSSAKRNSPMSRVPRNGQAMR